MADEKRDSGKGAAPFTIEISGPDAFITINVRDDGFRVSPEDLRLALIKEGVTAEILEDRIEYISREKPFGEKVAVARGVPAVPGEDGRIEYFFDYDSMGKPRIDEQGKADLKSINLIINVKPGDRLAKIHPPLPGVDGITVKGGVIKAPQGKAITLLPGVNVSPASDDPLTMEASVEGAVSVRDGVISVEAVMEIPGNVDYATGNIDFKGALTVRGDIKSGFSVKTGASLIVQGVVEDAIIFAGGDVNIHMGCVGTGKGRIESEGSVFVRFAERQNLKARRDVVAGDYLLNCVVRAGDSVRALDNSGIILGGDVTAANSVSAKVLGNPQGVETRITVGYSDEVLERFREIDEKKRQAVENLKKVEKGFQILKRVKIVRRELPEDKKALLLKLVDVARKLHDMISDADGKKEKLMEELGLKEDMFVTVIGPAHPGVTLNFRDRGYRVEQTESRITYRLSKGEVQKTFMA